MRSKTDSFLSNFKRRQGSVAEFLRTNAPIYDDVVVTLQDENGGDYSYKARVKRPAVLIGILPCKVNEPAIAPSSFDGISAKEIGG